MSHRVLITGATGFLGRRLLRNWLRETDAQLVVLVRQHNGRSPAERFGAELAGGDPVLAEALQRRVTVLAADLTVPDLGLDPENRHELTGAVTHIVHCGGVVRFDVSLAVARRTNTDGTAAMLALAEQCRCLERFDHISTAFVAGRRRGTVYENELDCGQRTNNGYERSKLEAEILVRRAARSLPITVHRPSIITCETRTGELAPHGAVGRLLAAYAGGKLSHLPGRPETPLDLVPVDFVADAVLAIARRAETIGGCFHLAAGPTGATPLARIRDLAAEHFPRSPLEIGASGAALPPDAAREEAACGAPSFRNELALYAPYLCRELTFDTRGAAEILNAEGIAVPDLATYFEAMARAVARLVKHASRRSVARR